VRRAPSLPRRRRCLVPTARCCCCRRRPRPRPLTSPALLSLLSLGGVVLARRSVCSGMARGNTRRPSV